MTAARLGFWSCVAVVLVGLAYVVVLAVGFSRFGLHEPIRDPVLAIMEVLTLLSAAPLVTMVAALHARAAEERRVFGVAAVAFVALFAGTTSAVHFVELTAVRQLGGGGIAWPSRSYALELLAWDVFLGLALVLAAAGMGVAAHERAARRSLRACGALCLLGTIGPVVGNMRLQLIGVLGYAVVLPISAALLARLFARDGRTGVATGRATADASNAASVQRQAGAPVGTAAVSEHPSGGSS